MANSRDGEQELLVISKTYDFVRWLSERIVRFPRGYRYVLGDRMERNQYDLLEILLRAKYSKSKLELLREANMRLEVLRYQLRLANELQCLKLPSYAHAGKLVGEIGAMIGGWSKACQAREAARPSS